MSGLPETREITITMRNSSLMSTSVSRKVLQYYTIAQKLLRIAAPIRLRMRKPWANCACAVPRLGCVAPSPHYWLADSTQECRYALFVVPSCVSKVRRARGKPARLWVFACFHGTGKSPVFFGLT